MSNLPPCGACSYTPETGTLSISISPKFSGTLHSGRLILRADSGEEIVHPFPNVLTAGDSAVLQGLGRPEGFKVRAATLAWTVRGGDAGNESPLEQAIFVRH